MASLSEIHVYYRNKSVDEIIALLEDQLPPETQDLLFREMWRDVITQICFTNLRPRIELNSDYSEHKHSENLRWLFFVVSAIAPYWFPDAEKMTRSVTYTNLAQSDWLIGALLFGNYELFITGLKNAPIVLSMKKNHRLELTVDQERIVTKLSAACALANDNSVKRAENSFAPDLLRIVKQQLDILEADCFLPQKESLSLGHSSPVHPLLGHKFWDDLMSKFFWISPIPLFFTHMGILDKLGILDELLGTKIVFFERTMQAFGILDVVLASLVYIFVRISNSVYGWNEEQEKKISTL